MARPPDSHRFTTMPGIHFFLIFTKLYKNFFPSKSVKQSGLCVNDVSSSQAPGRRAPLETLSWVCLVTDCCTVLPLRFLSRCTSVNIEGSSKNSEPHWPINMGKFAEKSYVSLVSLAIISEQNFQIFWWCKDETSRTSFWFFSLSGWFYHFYKKKFDWDLKVWSSITSAKRCPLGDNYLR